MFFLGFGLSCRSPGWAGRKVGWLPLQVEIEEEEEEEGDKENHQLDHGAQQQLN
jgi:hypothetical protein